MDQCQQRTGCKLTENGKQNSEDDRESHRSMNCAGNAVALPCADEFGNQDICTDSDADANTDDQCDNFSVCTNGSECVGISELPGNGSVSRIEKLLQNAAGCNGQCEQQYFFDERTVQHIQAVTGCFCIHGVFMLLFQNL